MQPLKGPFHLPLLLHSGHKTADVVTNPSSGCKFGNKLMLLKQANIRQQTSANIAYAS